MPRKTRHHDLKKTHVHSVYHKETHTTTHDHTRTMPSTEEVMKMLEHESYTNLAALTGADAEQLRREAAERIMTQLKTSAAFNDPEPLLTRRGTEMSTFS